MSVSAREQPARGKIHPLFFDQVIARQLGAPSSRVLVGPRNGVDAGVLDLGHGQVLVVTTDPLFVVPEYGWRRAGWFAVHILASDVATSGLAPQFMTADLNLPLATTDEELAELWEAIHDSAMQLGISVVTGHTGRYDGCGYPMAGGSTMFAIGSQQAYVSVGMTRPDDVVLVTKSAALEAAGLMAVTFEKRLGRAFGAKFSRQAAEIFWEMSTVKDALTAARVGVRERGVTAMHDATECGVYGGLYEMAQAAGVGMDIEVAAIPVRPDIASICEHFEMDPYTSISEGTLLLTCRPPQAEDIRLALADQGIAASCVGSCSAASGVRLHESGATRTLEHPRIDPFWGAFARAVASP